MARVLKQTWLHLKTNKRFLKRHNLILAEFSKVLLVILLFYKNIQ